MMLKKIHDLGYSLNVTFRRLPRLPSTAVVVEVAPAKPISMITESGRAIDRNPHTFVWSIEVLDFDDESAIGRAATRRKIQASIDAALDYLLEDR